MADSWPPQREKRSTMSERMEVSRTVAASAEAVWALVNDPQGHVRLDGSGMLEASTAGDRITAVGQFFDIAMDREPLGDLPMGKYLMRNEVTALEPGRLIEWAPRLVDSDRRIGHVYGWTITPLGEGTCTVTNYTDWSGVPDKYRHRWPIVPQVMLERTLDRLQELVEEGAS
jgi:uncharacterized protein YndB with AHSA1/START domain